MNRIIFLNDVFGAKDITPWSRYLGPYLVAQSIEDNLPDWEIVIIDYFTKIDNFFEYIKSFINEDTKYIAISSTFLHNPFDSKQNHFNLWFPTHDDTCEWFGQLKLVAPHVEFIIGGALIDTIYKTQIVQKVDIPFPKVLETHWVP